MPRYVIHVGPHKTGTTYMQQRFRALRGEMAARGIVYPEIWEFSPRNPSLMKLVEKLRAGAMDELAPHFAALNASDAEIVLLSAEDLSNSELDVLRRLKALTDGRHVEIVFAVRRWSALIPSTWQEGVKQGHAQSLPEYMLMHVLRPDASRLLNLDLKLSVLSDVFGPESVRLVSFDELRAAGLDLFDHFAARFLDWPDPPGNPDPQLVNVSRDPIDTELVRALNAIHAAQGGARNSDLRRLLEAGRAGLDLRMVKAAMRRHVRKIRFNDDGKLLRPLQRRLAERYARLMVPPAPEGTLFRPAVEDLAYVSADYLFADGVAAALQAVRSGLLGVG